MSLADSQKQVNAWLTADLNLAQFQVNGTADGDVLELPKAKDVREAITTWGQQVIRYNGTPFTASDAETHLAKWQAASLACATGQRVRLRGESVAYAPAEEIRKMVAFWTQQVTGSLVIYR